MADSIVGINDASRSPGDGSSSRYIGPYVNNTSSLVVPFVDKCNTCNGRLGFLINNMDWHMVNLFTCLLRPRGPTRLTMLLRGSSFNGLSAIGTDVTAWMVICCFLLGVAGSAWVCLGGLVEMIATPDEDVLFQGAVAPINGRHDLSTMKHSEQLAGQAQRGDRVLLGTRLGQWLRVKLPYSGGSNMNTPWQWLENITCAELLVHIIYPLRFAVVGIFLLAFHTSFLSSGRAYDRQYMKMHQFYSWCITEGWISVVMLCKAFMYFVWLKKSWRRRLRTGQVWYQKTQDGTLLARRQIANYWCGYLTNRCHCNYCIDRSQLKPRNHQCIAHLHAVISFICRSLHVIGLSAHLTVMGYLHWML